MSEERSIQDYLDDILNAVYGEEVRNSIVGAIEKCYEDGSAGAVDMIARARLDVVEPIAENAQDTANANVLASLQAEKKFTLEGVNDINAAIEPGKYYADTATLASAIANQPSDKTASITFAVLVLQHVATTNVIQILIDSQWKMWIRRGNVSGSAWAYGGWQRFLRSSDLSDINTALATKAPLASPTLTGTPKAPTAAQGNNSTQIATTAYVDTGLATKAPIASPTLTGAPKAPTPAASSNDTTLATTNYVTRAISNFKGAFDTAMSSTSVNAVQNKVVYAALATKPNKDGGSMTNVSLGGHVSIQETPAASDSTTAAANTQFVHRAIDAQATVATTGTATKGLMSQADKIYLENTKPYSVPSARFIQWTGFSITTTQSRIIITNMTGTDSTNRYGMVTVYMTVNTTESISEDANVVGVPAPVGTPCFGIVVRGQSGVIPAYVNSDGNVITTQAIASGKRIYFNISYYAKISSTWR